MDFVKNKSVFGIYFYNFTPWEQSYMTFPGNFNYVSQFVHFVQQQKKP